LIDNGDSAPALRVRARYAFLKNDTARALELLEFVRSSFADDFTDADAKTLAEYREASTAAE
jgi:hypothetical protein